MPISTPEQQDTANRITVAMRDHTKFYTASISRIISYDYGEACGTGTYLRLRGHPYLVTNEHVAAEVRANGLAHILKEDFSAFRIVEPFQCLAYPADLAMSRLDGANFALGTKSAVDADRLARQSLPRKDEVLFVHGFPGKNSHFSALAGALYWRSLPYLTCEGPLPDGYDPSMHFALRYPALPVTSIDGKSVTLPPPGGLSGTAVWDTHFNQSGGRWTPDLAEICGVVFEWHIPSQSLIAVRSEVVRAFLVEALRQEAAYFRWLARSSPLHDDWDDWHWAADTIRDIN